MNKNWKLVGFELHTHRQGEWLSKKHCTERRKGQIKLHVVLGMEKGEVVGMKRKLGLTYNL
ncbi:MAG: hypothetical protein RMK75_05400 [Aquificaceae bacterium]|nr:hypothetical protein [Aquificaceae bacterium]MCS7277722.1 hypothetical protein [Aquificaceae bacterium]MDW8423742.1 hypothetical protein [Aquificaceae bacterium]